MSRSSEGQGHLEVKVIMLHVCEYEVNRWTNEKLLEENKILTQIVNDAGQPPARTDTPIYLSKKVFEKSGY